MQTGKSRRKELEFFLRCSVEKRGEQYVKFHSRFTVCSKVTLEMDIVGDFNDRRNNLCANK